MRALENDNEENAVVCSRIIIELHKNYRSSSSAAGTSILESQVQPFLDIVQRIYGNLPKAMEAMLDKAPATTASKVRGGARPRGQGVCAGRAQSEVSVYLGWVRGGWPGGTG